jgi:hypothetical protein
MKGEGLATSGEKGFFSTVGGKLTAGIAGAALMVGGGAAAKAFFYDTKIKEPDQQEQPVDGSYQDPLEGLTSQPDELDVAHDQPEQEGGSYYIMSESERQEIFGRYDFNPDGRMSNFGVNTYYDIDNDKTIDLDKAVTFDLPNHSGRKVEEDKYGYSNGTVYYNINPQFGDGYITGDGYVNVIYGKDLGLNPSFYESHFKDQPAETLQTDYFEVYIQEYKETSDGMLIMLIYLQSPDVNGGEKFLLCEIEAGNNGRESSSELKQPELDKIAKAVASAIVETATPNLMKQGKA